MKMDNTELSKDDLLKAYRIMKTIRTFEERVHVEFAAGRLSGVVHLYAGQEACAAGVCMHLDDKDYIASTHRGHGHCIAKGVSIPAMMAELFGRATGICRGKGGSMHIADLELGMIGANGIVGGGPPLICGAALAAKFSGERNVAVTFIGDGATNQGTTLESLNLAKIWNLPVVFVVEDNGYAEATSSEYAIGAESNAARARGFGLPAAEVDGQDFFAVYEAAREAVERARQGDGPTLLECHVTRYYGHFEGDAQTYRAAKEVSDVLGARDCIELFSQRVTASGLIDRTELQTLDENISELVASSVATANAAPKPEGKELFSHVYANY